MLKTYEIIFKVEADSKEEAARFLANDGYNLTDYSDIREILQEENFPKYTGKMLTILDYQVVEYNTHIYERNGWRGLLQVYEDTIYKIKPLDTPWTKYDWFIYEETIDELLERGAITIT